MMSTPTQTYPLLWPAGWPRKQLRVRSRFGKWNKKPSIEHGTTEIRRELNLMGARGLVISANLVLRLDGLPRSGQPTPKDPGIAVYFQRKGQQQVIACDTFDLPGCNLYAIARTIGALRQMDRDGCSELMDRAFTGFKALPQTGSPESWRDVLGLLHDATFEDARAAYRRLALIAHPDKETGSAEAFQRINTAWNEAQKHFCL